MNIFQTKNSKVDENQHDSKGTTTSQAKLVNKKKKLLLKLQNY